MSIRPKNRRHTILFHVIYLPKSLLKVHELNVKKLVFCSNSFCSIFFVVLLLPEVQSLYSCFRVKYLEVHFYETEVVES